MSYFGAKLEELLKRNATSGADVSRATGIGDGTISRWISRRQKFVSHDDLKSLTAVISKDRVQKAELIHAHLLDECVGEGSELIKIEITGQQHLKDTTTANRTSLPQTIQKDLDIIGTAAITDPDVRKIVSTVARMASKQSLG